jgi:hypothetical protein
MRTLNFLVSTVLCVAALSPVAPKIYSTVLAQAERTPSPNALDAQDRFRDRERERAHDEVRERLGDRSPGLPSGQGFTAPSTDLKPDVPNAGPKSNQSR